MDRNFGNGVLARLIQDNPDVRAGYGYSAEPYLYEQRGETGLFAVRGDGLTAVVVQRITGCSPEFVDGWYVWDADVQDGLQICPVVRFASPAATPGTVAAVLIARLAVPAFRDVDSTAF